MLLSTDSDLELLGNLIRQAGFQIRLVATRSIVIEALLIGSIQALQPILEIQVEAYCEPRSA